jgi:hypothetical protein
MTYVYTGMFNTRILHSRGVQALISHQIEVDIDLKKLRFAFHLQSTLTSVSLADCGMLFLLSGQQGFVVSFNDRMLRRLTFVNNPRLSRRLEYSLWHPSASQAVDPLFWSIQADFHEERGKVHLATDMRELSLFVRSFHHVPTEFFVNSA